MARSIYREEFNLEIEKIRKEFIEFKDNSSLSINEILEEYKKAIDDIHSKVGDLANVNSSCNSILGNIEEIEIEINRLAKSIKQTREEVCGDDDSILNDIKESQTTINEIYNKIINANVHVFGSNKTLKMPIQLSRYNMLSEEQRETKDGKYFEIVTQETLGVKEKLDGILSKFSDLEERELEKISARDKKIDAKNNEVYDKITALLPGATAAGLTVAYETAKAEAKKQITLWSIFFACSLLGIVIESSLLIYYGAISFGPDITLEKAIIQILRIIGLEFPFIWLAWAANIKISQYSRLYEEYRHKWTMTRTFEGMQKAIENSENANEESNTGFFYQAILKTFAANPSETLDKKYAPDGPISLISSLKDSFSKKNKKEIDEGVDGIK